MRRVDHRAVILNLRFVLPHLKEVEADGVISLHGDGSVVLRDNLQTLQSFAVTPRQHLWTETHTNIQNLYSGDKLKYGSGCKYLIGPVLHVLPVGGERHRNAFPGFLVLPLARRLTAQLGPTLLKHSLPLVLCGHTQTAQLPVTEEKTK